MGISHSLGFSLANRLGARNVVPFTGPASILLKGQLATLLAALRVEGITHMYVETTPAEFPEPRLWTQAVTRALVVEGLEYEGEITAGGFGLQHWSRQP